MSAPLVSILLPLHPDTAAKPAVLSALAQTWRPLEILAAGSTISAPLRKFCTAHPEVRTVQTAPNADPAAAALDAAQGDYLLFLDAGDTLSPDAVATLLTHLLACRADVCAGQFTVGGHAPAGDGLCRQYTAVPDAAPCPDLCRAGGKLYRREIALQTQFGSGTPLPLTALPQPVRLALLQQPLVRTPAAPAQPAKSRRSILLRCLHR